MLGHGRYPFRHQPTCVWQGLPLEMAGVTSAGGSAFGPKRRIPSGSSQLHICRIPVGRCGTKHAHRCRVHPPLPAGLPPSAPDDICLAGVPGFALRRRAEGVGRKQSVEQPRSVGDPGQRTGSECRLRPDQWGPLCERRSWILDVLAAHPRPRANGLKCKPTRRATLRTVHDMDLPFPRPRSRSGLSAQPCI